MICAKKRKTIKKIHTVHVPSILRKFANNACGYRVCCYFRYMIMCGCTWGSLREHKTLPNNSWRKEARVATKHGKQSR